jgi:WD40 repeat protein
MQVSFSPDARHLASVAGRWQESQDKRILLWDVASGKQIRSFAEAVEDEEPADNIWCVAFSADGKSLFGGGSQGHIRRWDVRTGEILQTFDTGMENVRDLAPSPDGRYLASTGFDLPSFVLWDLKNGTAVFELDDGPVDDVAYSPTGRHAAYAFRNPSGARVVNVAQRSVEAFLDTGITWSVEFSPDGTQLATAGNSSIIQLWDVETWRLEREFEGHNGRIRSLAFTPDGERLASRGDDDTIRIWNTDSGKEVLTLAAPPNRDSIIIFSPDGRTLASGTEDGSVKLWPTFPWREEDYPGSTSLPFAERAEQYKRQFWRDKLPQLEPHAAAPSM